MIDNKRLRVWNWVLKTVKHPEGVLMPFWLRCVYCFLFPIKFFFWHMNEGFGYKIETDTWDIYGKKYSDILFRHFAIGGDETFKIIQRDDGVITLQLVEKDGK